MNKIYLLFHVQTSIKVQDFRVKVRILSWSIVPLYRTNYNFTRSFILDAPGLQYLQNVRIFAWKEHEEETL